MGFDTDSPASWGVLSGLFLALSAHAGHWFITSPPDPGAVRVGLVGLQLIACAALSWWTFRRGRSLEEDLRDPDGIPAAA